MLTLSLREFQRQGGKALPGPSGGPFLLQGQGEQFLVLRVGHDFPPELLDELQGFAAIMALRENQARAVESCLDHLSMVEVEAEIKSARAERRNRPNL